MSFGQERSLPTFIVDSLGGLPAGQGTVIVAFHSVRVYPPSVKLPILMKPSAPNLEPQGLAMPNAGHLRLLKTGRYGHGNIPQNGPEKSSTKDVFIRSSPRSRRAGNQPEQARQGSTGSERSLLSRAFVQASGPPYIEFQSAVSSSVTFAFPGPARWPNQGELCLGGQGMGRWQEELL